MLARFAERILVIYAASIVEQGSVSTIYGRATHPYTWGLMQSVTRVDERRRHRLSPIRGTPPSRARRPTWLPVPSAVPARYQRALGDNGTAGVLCYR